jgi:hypothetical protein
MLRHGAQVIIEYIPATEPAPNPRHYARDADAFRDHAGAGLLWSARRQVFLSKRPPGPSAGGFRLGPRNETTRAVARRARVAPVGVPELSFGPPTMAV